MPTELTPAEVLMQGVRTLHERMDSGEMRFRLLFGDGSSYVHTFAASPAAWQNSHVHSGIFELTLVQEGAFLFVELENGALRTQICRKNEFVISRPGIPHNMYIAAGSDVHTIKYGSIAPNDWAPQPELDALSRGLDPEALLQ